MICYYLYFLWIEKEKEVNFVIKKMEKKRKEKLLPTLAFLKPKPKLRWRVSAWTSPSSFKWASEWLALRLDSWNYDFKNSNK